jgi:hypothetical protein
MYAPVYGIMFYGGVTIDIKHWLNIKPNKEKNEISIWYLII